MTAKRRSTSPVTANAVPPYLLDRAQIETVKKERKFKPEYELFESFVKLHELLFSSRQGFKGKLNNSDTKKILSEIERNACAYIKICELRISNWDLSQKKTSQFMSINRRFLKSLDLLSNEPTALVMMAVQSVGPEGWCDRRMKLHEFSKQQEYHNAPKAMNQQSYKDENQIENMVLFAKEIRLRAEAARKAIPKRRGRNCDIPRSFFVDRTVKIYEEGTGLQAKIAAKRDLDPKPDKSLLDIYSGDFVFFLHQCCKLFKINSIGFGLGKLAQRITSNPFDG